MIKSRVQKSKIIPNKWSGFECEKVKSYLIDN